MIKVGVYKYVGLSFWIYFVLVFWFIGSVLMVKVFRFIVCMVLRWVYKKNKINYKWII